MAFWKRGCFLSSPSAKCYRRLQVRAEHRMMRKQQNNNETVSLLSMALCHRGAWRHLIWSWFPKAGIWFDSFRGLITSNRSAHHHRVSKLQSVGSGETEALKGQGTSLMPLKRPLTLPTPSVHCTTVPSSGWTPFTHRERGWQETP